ncbi:hypothetical protein MCC02038_19640 [Bifidobacteriaceae bacterium MCC02038]|nr:hypothetical protein MCC02038_19640 [Bifidobacteriaceae bacterium MCC02038]
MRALVYVREVRQAGERERQKNDDGAVHLAEKWDGKEEIINAVSYTHLTPPPS